MNKSLMLASPKAGEYFCSFYLTANFVLLFLIGHLAGYRPLPSVTLNKYASLDSLYVKSLTQLKGLYPPKICPSVVLTNKSVDP